MQTVNSIKRRSRGEDYVNNKEFSAAVAEYAKGVEQDVANGKEPRQLSNYIGECFLKIANGLSRSPNFTNYSYREDMVMDAVENCVKAVIKFDRAAFEQRKSKVTDMFESNLTENDLELLGKQHGSPTKSVQRWYKEWVNGTPQGQVPNAFAYFTQISYFAFLRRIAKEKRQASIKLSLTKEGSIGTFADFNDDSNHSAESMVEKIRNKNDAYFNHPKAEPKLKKKNKKLSLKETKKISQIPITNFFS